MLLYAQAAIPLLLYGKLLERQTVFIYII